MHRIILRAKSREEPVETIAVHIVEVVMRHNAGMTDLAGRPLCIGIILLSLPQDVISEWILWFLQMVAMSKHLAITLRIHFVSRASNVVHSCLMLIPQPWFHQKLVFFQSYYSSIKGPHLGACLQPLRSIRYVQEQEG